MYKVSGQFQNNAIKDVRTKIKFEQHKEFISLMQSNHITFRLLITVYKKDMKRSITRI